MLRKPIVAGRFYPKEPEEIENQLRVYTAYDIEPSILPDKILAGIVPHAGWICSGKVAGKVFKAIKEKNKNTTPDTFIIYGAVHQYGVRRPSIYPRGMWQSPIGKVEIDEELAETILEYSSSVITSYEAHLAEHSIEVQIPFIRYLFPQAKIVPIAMPPTEEAISVGREIAEATLTSKKEIVFIGSTDLTHYGPSYGFVPKGTGLMGIRWAKEVNDKNLLEYILNMDAEGALEYALKSHAACGAGAIAATISSARALGAKKADLLEHTTSYEVLRELYGDLCVDSVGYAAIVFGK